MKTLKSKKFIAYLLSDITSTGLLALGILYGDFSDQAVLLAIALSRGVTAIGFILGQSYVDRYVDTIIASKDKND